MNWIIENIFGRGKQNLRKTKIKKIEKNASIVRQSIFQVPIENTRVVENSYSGVLSGEEKVLFFSPEKETGAESLKAPESVSGVLRVFQDII